MRRAARRPRGRKVGTAEENLAAFIARARESSMFKSRALNWDNDFWDMRHVAKRTHGRKRVPLVHFTKHSARHRVARVPLEQPFKDFGKAVIAHQWNNRE